MKGIWDVLISQDMDFGKIGKKEEIK